MNEVDPKEIHTVTEMPGWKKFIRPWVENKIHEYEAKYDYLGTQEELKLNQEVRKVLSEFLRFIDDYATGWGGENYQK